MDEAVERLELAVGGDVERDDHAMHGSRPEARADEMTDTDIEPVGDAIGEGACGAAQAGEDRDLRGPSGHNS
jgi:hypothetical protein